jgi:magnesium-transporting ATPase (P-type)
VPETIHQLAMAGIKIWVCTGDKEETAINIAAACQLIDSSMVLVRINEKAYPTCRLIEQRLSSELASVTQDLARAAADPGASGKVRKRALVVDGVCLAKCLDDPSDPEHGTSEDVALKSLMAAFGNTCHAVVACRVSPQQKADMVELIKGKKAERPDEEDWAGVPGATCLGIGDGANDVPMILKAHIGVGISGLEGAQAVNSADFAVAQFRFLKRLLLVHGRYNHMRTFTLVCYMFYKNILLAMVQFWYFFCSGPTSQKFYLEFGGASGCYNVCLTAFPIIILGVLDQDVSDYLAENEPRLYYDALCGRLSNAYMFWQWIWWALYESVVIFVCVKCAFDSSYSSGVLDVATANPIDSPWAMGLAALTLVVLCANFRLMLVQQSWCWYHVVVYGISIGFWFLAAAWCASYYGWAGDHNFFQSWEQYQVWYLLLNTPDFWLLLPVATGACLLPTYFQMGCSRYLNPLFRDVMSTMEQRKGSHFVRVGGMVHELLQQMVAAEEKEKVQKERQGHQQAQHAAQVSLCVRM